MRTAMRSISDLSGLGCVGPGLGRRHSRARGLGSNRVICILSLLLAWSGCLRPKTAEHANWQTEADLSAKPLSLNGGGPRYLEQGWSPELRQQFYTTTQGSEMMRYDWFLALEDPNTKTRLADSLSRFGYLPNSKSPSNPDGLPVGFTKDTDDQGVQ